MELSIQSLLHEVLQLTNNVSTLKTDTAKQNAEIEAQKAMLAKQNAEIVAFNTTLTTERIKNSNTGSTFIRWGKSSCSGSDAQLVYSGYTAGQHYNQYLNRFGGAANFLCLPSDPELSNITSGANSFLFGTEFAENILRTDSVDEDVPCAVCKSTNSHTSIMIPGRQTCYSGWKMEYYGLLASDNYAFSASSFICVDRHPEYVFGGQEDKNGRLLYITKTKCGSLSCPPYKDDEAVNCVVCSQ